MGYSIVLVGRPNVGKSTLFNRLVGRKEAIVTDIAGTTRDRIYGQATWNGVDFSVIDTGGFNISGDKIDTAINRQIDLGIDTAKVVLFLVDAHDDITAEDKMFANILRKKIKDKPLIVVANKSDNAVLSTAAYKFMSLGLGAPIPISAINGGGTGELLDIVVDILKQIKTKTDTQDVNLPRLAIIGKPNVGKSSLLNVLLCEERMLVDDASGTTRDAIDAEYNFYGQHFILVDTAGIRKKAKKKEDIEFYSTLRSINAIEKCDVCLYVLDATLGIERQDLSLVSLAVRRGKGILILVNKSDLITEKEKKKIKINIEERLKNMSFIPILFISALGKKNLFKVVTLAMDVFSHRKEPIKTSKLNDVLLPIIKNYPPSSRRGQEIKIKYITQLRTAGVTIAFFCNYPKEIKENYKSFLENQLRQSFHLDGVPIKLVFRESK